MGYELDMEDYRNGNHPIEYQESLKLAWKIHKMLVRAEQIARDIRIEMGVNHECYVFDIQCDCEMPEFQEELHPAHNFNKYLMEQRMRYGSQD